MIFKIKVCSECQTSFHKAGRSWTCSDECKEQRAVRLKREREELVVISCRSCGAGFSRRRKQRTRECSEECRINYNSMKSYGIKYYELLASQGGKCAICKSEFCKLDRKSRFCVDHNHDTGLPRGLLCNTCNQGSGQFSDDPEIVHRAAEYLYSYMPLNELLARATT